jgi:glycosyltransferase involved in cell wall biosynthesis
MQPSISVITCTHNPNTQTLAKVLSAIRYQTLSLTQWEYLVIDNASDKNLSSLIDVSWHPMVKILREETLGLTPARLRGIKEAKADVLVFVDDDNVLDPDYLEVALQISKDYPFIGAWGGQIKPLFESEPPDWIIPYLPMLAIRQFDKDKWSNLPTPYETAPCGAGLCLRRIVAEKYVEYLQRDDLRKNLDRKGKLLVSCGDSDLALTACDIGLGTGQFTVLKMGHIIPESRCHEDYLLSLQENFTFSQVILNKIRQQPLPFLSLKEEIKNFGRQLFMNSREQSFDKARQRGIKRAIEYLEQTKT